MQISLSKLCGIYYLRSISTYALYVGSSIDALARLGQHLHALENNRHPCDALQIHFNTTGRSDLEFVFVSTVDRDLLHAEAAHYWSLRRAGNVLFNTQKPRERKRHMLRSPKGARAVLNVTTGDLFASLSAAARAAGVATPQALNYYLKTGKPLRDCVWQTLDWSDYEKMIEAQNTA